MSDENRNTNENKNMITNENENTDTSRRTNMFSRISFDQFLRHQNFTGRVKCWIYDTNMHGSICKSVNFNLFVLRGCHGTFFLFSGHLCYLK